MPQLMRLSQQDFDFPHSAGCQSAWVADAMVVGCVGRPDRPVAANDFEQQQPLAAEGSGKTSVSQSSWASVEKSSALPPGRVARYCSKSRRTMPVEAGRLATA
mmetsp:Transcript_44772/g.104321  ORF Transcript_44772/g.104321 Transcript_44772/m.104321 type:complete len:103 (-) Transcript_44772:412-720(-)